MSQTTRCPACETTFKVVADQLKIAHGWVRCGQCGEVFDASVQHVPDETVLPALGPTPLRDGVENAEAVPVSPDDLVAAASPAVEAPPQDALAVSALLRHPTLETLEPAPAEPCAVSEVSFVHDARRKEFWKTPLLRAALGLLSLLLLSALALQWMAHEKDALAALHPRLVPLLEALCRPMDCEIRPLRRIGSLAIDSSSFSKTGPDSYRLNFVLKNNDATALEIPAVEITLTDNRDQALIRRIIAPRQFGAVASTLGAHLELSGAVSLQVAGESARGASPAQAAPLPVAGYRIVAFYP